MMQGLDLTRKIEKTSLALYGRRDTFSVKSLNKIPLESISFSAHEKIIIGRRKKKIHRLTDLLNECMCELYRSKDRQQCHLAAKVAYKRALLLIHLHKFCEASVNGAFAIDFLQTYYQDAPDHKEKLILDSKVIFEGLLEEMFTLYCHSRSYTASDCQSNCGFCQDPISTMAKQYVDTITLLDAAPGDIQAAWTKAAAMLGGYALSKGADIENLGFGRKVPRQVANSIKLLIYSDKINFNNYLKMAQIYFNKVMEAKGKSKVN